MITLEKVNKVYSNGLHAVKDVSLKVNKGDIFGIIGLSGAGKSSLIRLINRLEEPTSGKIFINGENVLEFNKKQLLERRKKIGMIFQHFNLLSSRTVEENVAFALEIANWNKNEIKERVAMLLDIVGLSDKAKYYPSQLSGGQKQRVSIARALANNPDILLSDEATSALDPKTTKSILELLKKINNEFGITILLITHEMEVVKEICNKVAVMQDGEIKEQGNIIEIFTNPQENITKNFISSIINNDIPESLKEELDLNLPVVKLTFLGEKSGQPLISEINKKFDISTKILSASVNELGNTILGVLVVQLEGNPAIINEVEEFIKNRGVKIERMEII